MAQGIFISFGLVFVVFGLLVWRARKSSFAPAQFALMQDMRKFAHGFFYAPPGEQTERIDIFRETAASYRRQGLSNRQYKSSAARLETSLAPDEQKLLRTVTQNFVTGD